MFEAEESLSPEEVTAVKENARTRLKTWTQRAAYSGALLLISCAVVVPFLRGTRSMFTGLVWEISGYRSDGGVPLVRLLCSPMLGRLEHASQCREDVLLTLGRPFSYVQLPRYICKRQYS